MNCYQTQFLMDMYIANDPGLIIEKRRAFENHLQYCTKCSKEYQETKFIIKLVKQHWEVGEDALELIEKTGQSYKPKMTVEEGRQDLCKRCPDLGEKVNKRKRCQLIFRMSSVVGCLVIGVLTWITFSVYSKPQIAPKPVSQQVILAPKPSARIELVSKNDSVLAPAKQQINSADELKTLVINGKHRMTMNVVKVLALLQEKVTAACKYQNDDLHPQEEPKPSCG